MQRPLLVKWPIRKCELFHIDRPGRMTYRPTHFLDTPGSEGMMHVVRVIGPLLDALANHEDGQRGRLLFREPRPVAGWRRLMVTRAFVLVACALARGGPSARSRGLRWKR